MLEGRINNFDSKVMQSVFSNNLEKVISDASNGGLNLPKMSTRNYVGLHTIKTANGSDILALVRSHHSSHYYSPIILYNGRFIKVSEVHSKSYYASTDTIGEFDFNIDILNNISDTQYKLMLGLSLYADSANIFGCNFDSYKELMYSNNLADSQVFLKEMLEADVITKMSMDDILKKYSATRALSYKNDWSDSKLCIRSKHEIEKNTPSLTTFTQRNSRIIGRDTELSNNDKTIIDERLSDAMAYGNKVLFMYSTEVQKGKAVPFYGGGTVEPSLAVVEMNNSKDADLLAYLITMKVDVNIIKLIFKIRDLAESKTPLYSHHVIKGPTKLRDIYAPQDDIKEISKSMLFILNKIMHKRLNNANTYQFAYREGLSIVDNAKKHSDNKYMLNFDIEGFFDNCTWNLVRPYVKPFFRLFEKMYLFQAQGINLIKLIISALQLLIINPATNGIYQGNPLSGLISNLVLQPASNYLNNIFTERNITFSVYADDITLSATKHLSKPSALRTIDYVFDYYSLPFKLKEKKTKRVSNNKRKVTGLMINHNDDVVIPRSKYMLLKTILYRLSKNEEVTLNTNQILGLLSYAIHVDKTDKINRLVTKYSDVINDLKNGIVTDNSNIENKIDSIDELF